MQGKHIEKHIELDEAIRTGKYIVYKRGELLTPDRAIAVGGWLGLIGDGVYISKGDLETYGNPVDALVARLTHDGDGKRVESLRPITAAFVVPEFMAALGSELGAEFYIRLQGQFPNSNIGNRIIDAKDAFAKGDLEFLETR